MSSRIIISDIHGCMKTLQALIAKLPPGIPITFAGDLIDRAKDSRKVVDFVKNGDYDCVLGNHEEMMVNELEYKVVNGKEIATASYYDGIWLMNGGDTTLDSYLLDNGEQDVAALKEHQVWMKTLPVYIEYKDCRNAKGDYLLVSHSTAAYAWDEYPHDSQQFKDNLLWERTPNPAKIQGIYNIWGHTPQYDGARIGEHFAAIDGGCYYKRAHYGRMFALQYPELVLFEQENIEG